MTNPEGFTHVCNGCERAIEPVFREQGYLGKMELTCPHCGATRLIRIREWKGKS